MVCIYRHTHTYIERLNRYKHKYIRWISIIRCEAKQKKKHTTHPTYVDGAKWCSRESIETHHGVDANMCIRLIFPSNSCCFCFFLVAVVFSSYLSYPFYFHVRFDMFFFFHFLFAVFQPLELNRCYGLIHAFVFSLHSLSGSHHARDIQTIE